jgi:hypothetical protein
VTLRASRGMFLVEFNDPDREFLDDFVPVPAA